MRKVIILLAILAISFAFKPSQSAFCSDAEKQPGECFEIYKPVCAIQKAREQTRVDFSNRCLACKDVSTTFVVEGTCDSFPENANFCTSKPSKIGQRIFCPDVYQPVCGFYKPHIMCIQAPCAVTLSNSCYACNNSDIAYYVDGACDELLL